MLILAALSYTGEKFVSSVVDTGEQFFRGVVDTGDILVIYDQYQRHQENVITSVNNTID
jgi:hypothetical protein